LATLAAPDESLTAGYELRSWLLWQPLSFTSSEDVTVLVAERRSIAMYNPLQRGV
jgi:hypothetical protein